MKNVDIRVEDGKLVITVDLRREFGSSGSGKSVIVASSEGNAAVEGADAALRVGLNVYRIKPK